MNKDYLHAPDAEHTVISADLVALFSSILQEMSEACRVDRLSDCVEPEKEKPDRYDSALEELLARVNQTVILDSVVEEAFLQKQTRRLEPVTGYLLARRFREISGTTRQHRVKLTTSVSVRSVTIPDHSRDEIVLGLRIISGAEVSELEGLLVESGWLTREQVSAAVKQWMSNDNSIGREERELYALERCLGITLEGVVAESVRTVKYNYGMQSKVLWRTCETIVTMHVPLDLSNYPWDVTRVSLFFKTRQDFDPSECFLVIDEKQPIPIMPGDTVPPRGFSIQSAKIPQISFCSSLSPDELLESVLSINFVINRNPQAAILRGVLPQLLILLVALLMTGFAFLYPNYVESVSTQGLPTLFVALVALQLTATQHLPPNSGITALEKLFLTSYILLLLMLVSLGISVIL